MKYKDIESIIKRHSLHLDDKEAINLMEDLISFECDLIGDTNNDFVKEKSDLTKNDLPANFVEIIEFYMNAELEKINQTGHINIHDRNIMVNFSKKYSGFYKFTPDKFCNDVEHFIPYGLVILEGKTYEHICPNCGRKTILTNPKQ